jgi:hypothetical protein
MVSALEQAYERLVVALQLPPPLPDGDRGGSSALDLYLEAGPAEARAELDAIEVASPFDSGAAFCVVGGEERAAERAATLCLGEAIALRLDAGETPFSRRALATELWLVTGTPTSADARAIDDFQAAPARAVVARERSRAAEGSALFLDYLDLARGRGEPAGIALATYALSATAPSRAGWRWTNEPDTVDVLRATFGPTPTDLARLFADFAVARAFLGSRDADGQWPALGWASDLGRVAFEWSVPFASLPRRLAPRHPVEPTGATYVWLELGDAARGRTLVFEADWEPPVAFRWALVLVSAGGRALRRIDVPFLERETHVERIADDLTGAAGVLIVGTSLGGLGPSYPFDPDFEPFEPHGYTVSLSTQ